MSAWLSAKLLWEDWDRSCRKKRDRELLGHAYPMGSSELVDDDGAVNGGRWEGFWACSVHKWWVMLVLLLKERKHPKTVQENLSADESEEGEECVAGQVRIGWVKSLLMFFEGRLCFELAPAPLECARQQQVTHGGVVSITNPKIFAKSTFKFFTHIFTTAMYHSQPIDLQHQWHLHSTKLNSQPALKMQPHSGTDSSQQKGGWEGQEDCWNKENCQPRIKDGSGQCKQCYTKSKIHITPPLRHKQPLPSL